MLDDFQAAYPQVKVKFEPVAGDYPAAMAAKFSSGDVPDVFYVDSGPAPTWIDDGNLEPLDDYIAKTGVDTSVFYPAYLDAFKGADGKIYGLPKDGNTIAMAYNEDMLDGRRRDRAADELGGADRRRRQAQGHRGPRRARCACPRASTARSRSSTRPAAAS